MSRQKFCYFILGILSFFLTSSCITQDSSPPMYEIDQNTKTIFQKMRKIEDKLFEQKNVSRDNWKLVLVGDHETIKGDLCKDPSSTICSKYKGDHFQKLVAGNSYYEALYKNTKDLINAANTYFAGDVSVYTTDGVNAFKSEKYLNEIMPQLGKHELTLMDRGLINHLHTAGFGGVYWPAAVPLSYECFAPNHLSEKSRLLLQQARERVKLNHKRTMRAIDID